MSLSSRIEFLIQDLISFLTRRLANKLAFILVGFLINAKQNRNNMYDMQQSK